MTKPAQVFVLLFSFLFMFFGIEGLTGDTSDAFKVERVAEGRIRVLECPRKYSARLQLTTSDEVLYLPKSFKDSTGCRNEKVARSFTGKLVKLYISRNDKVVRAKISGKSYLTPRKTISDSRKSSITALFIGVFMFALWMFKRSK
ncbi:hypothetical protein L1077_20585 [Pseudoalteromonas luteoviolacea]|uniref:hypothetical protein n=1 Tax=Pseudoalteromonas luteoviolacea TaxID=43657 RepID=UPI001F373367|nr:hypothetical protein [Pseudoalteromonas luteoviolacea]MCF6441838.1 hypothetical protein [Pseudoalteromonas luteoviolacea]